MNITIRAKKVDENKIVHLLQIYGDLTKKPESV